MAVELPEEWLTRNQVHFHQAGRVLAVGGRVVSAVAPDNGGSANIAWRSRSADDRLMRAHLLAWGKPSRVTLANGSEVDEWWRRGAINLAERPLLYLNHRAYGGLRCGRVLSLIDGPTWLDALLAVDTGSLGDGVLGICDSNSRVPVSVAFTPRAGGSRIHRGAVPGVERVAAKLSEVAVCAQAAYADAYVWSRGPLV